MDHKEKQREERALWKKRINDLNTSSVTVTQYAKANELSVHQIYYWKAKFKDRSRNPPSLKAAEESSVIKVIPRLPARSSKLPDPKWVAELIKAIHEVF